MTFQQLQYLLVAQQTNSISKAAEKLFVAPSSVSACINSLEKELGFPVFVRNQKGLVPTAKGESVLQYAQRMVKIYDQMGTLGEEEAHHLRVCANDYYPFCAAFARIVEEYRGHDNLVFQMGTNTQQGAIKCIQSGEVDVVVVTVHTAGWKKLEKTLRENALQWQIMKEVPYSICVGEPHPLYGCSTVQLSQLHKEVLIDSSGSSFGNGFWGELVEINTDQRIRVGNDIARWELLRQGVGYSVEIYAPTEKLVGLRRIPVEGVTATLCAITNPTQPPNLLVDRYIQLLEQELN